MPIVLANAHSHEFTYADAAGAVHTVRVTRGQAIPDNVPVEVISQLVSEMVVSFNGETLLPRYVSAPETGEKSYTSGVVSTRAQEAGLAAQDAPQADKYDADAIAAKLAEAEAAAEAEAQRAVDAEAAAVAAAEQLAREAAEDAVDEPVVEEIPAAEEAPVDVRAELRAELDALGVKVHPATGEEKLREKLAEARAAAADADA